MEAGGFLGVDADNVWSTEHPRFYSVAYALDYAFWSAALVLGDPAPPSPPLKRPAVSHHKRRSPHPAPQPGRIVPRTPPRRAPRSRRPRKLTAPNAATGERSVPLPPCM